MGEQLFFHEQYGPYQQLAQIKVKDHGNKLPIHLALVNGDPYGVQQHSMTVGNAEMYHRQLGEAIKAAKKGGLE